MIVWPFTYTSATFSGLCSYFLLVLAVVPMQMLVCVSVSLMILCAFSG